MRRPIYFNEFVSNPPIYFIGGFDTSHIPKENCTYNLVLGRTLADHINFSDPESPFKTLERLHSEKYYSKTPLVTNEKVWIFYDKGSLDQKGEDGKLVWGDEEVRLRSLGPIYNDLSAKSSNIIKRDNWYAIHDEFSNLNDEKYSFLKGKCDNIYFDLNVSVYVPTNVLYYLLDLLTPSGKIYYRKIHGKPKVEILNDVNVFHSMKQKILPDVDDRTMREKNLCNDINIDDIIVDNTKIPKHYKYFHTFTKYQKWMHIRGDIDRIISHYDCMRTHTNWDHGNPCLDPRDLRRITDALLTVLKENVICDIIASSYNMVGEVEECNGAYPLYHQLDKPPITYYIISKK